MSNLAALLIFMGLSLFCVKKVLEHRGRGDELSATKWATIGLANVVGMFCCLAGL